MSIDDKAESLIDDLRHYYFTTDALDRAISAIKLIQLIAEKGQCNLNGSWCAAQCKSFLEGL